MMFQENMRLAFTALWANKSRALLTMLGIIIGIGSVIAIMTVGNSLSNSISSSMQGMGANNITVGLQSKEQSEETSGDGYSFGTIEIVNSEPSEKDRITDEMMEDYVSKYGDEIEGIELTEGIGKCTAKEGSHYANLSVKGINNYYFQAETIECIAGRFFSNKEQQGAQKVAFVSDRLVENIFNGDNASALGNVVEVYGPDDEYNMYTIIGVYKYDDSKNNFVTTKRYDTETDLYIPFKTAKDINHSPSGYTQLKVVSAIGVDSEALATKTKNYLNRYYVNNQDYRVSAFSMASVLETMTSMLDNVSIAIAIVAAISLVVGGIGVMNIMLVSITERTREIGTRKAMGAKNGYIRAQFIFEAVVICLVGGFIGILLGIGLGAVASNFLGFPTSPSVSSIVLSVSFSIAIGVFFGYYPANKAAKLDPIEALRYE